MNKANHTPALPAAHIALYGKPGHTEEDQFIELFRQLSEANKRRSIQFLQALAEDDQAIVNAIKREIEIEQAYLQHDRTREQLAEDLDKGRTPSGLQDIVRAGLAKVAGGVA